MIRLVYLSAASPAMKEAELGGILAASRRNNTAAGVTGILLYGRGSFIQVLEGEEAAVNERLEQIKKDPRHSALKTILTEPIETRDFPDWSMGYRALRGDERGLDGLINLRDRSADIIPSAAAATVAAFLKSFRAANIDTDAA